VATAEDVERCIKGLAKKLAAAAPDPEQVPNRSIICDIPDLDTAFWVELKGARLRGLKQVARTEAADARLTARSDDLIALVEGRLNAGIAFLTGKVRIDAPPKDLMMLRRLF
jgi:predicted lipid carrier protein YhbT